MTECLKYMELISCYVDGEITEIEKAELDAHLAECSSCRSLLKMYQSMSDSITDDMAEPPEELAKKVMSEIMAREVYPLTDVTKTGKSRKTRFTIIGRYVTAAACIALIVLVAPRMANLGCGTSNSDTCADSDIQESAATTDSSASNDTAAKDETRLSADADTAADDSTACDDTDTASADGTEDKYGNSLTEGIDVEAFSLVITIQGNLPESLADSEFEDGGDGTYYLTLSLEAAEELLSTDALYDAEHSAERFTYGNGEAVIVYMP